MKSGNPQEHRSDPLQAFEAELARLKPRSPSPFLSERLSQAIAAEQRRRRWRAGLWAGAAALLVAAMAWQPWRADLVEEKSAAAPAVSGAGTGPKTPALTPAGTGKHPGAVRLAGAEAGESARLVPAEAAGYVVGWEDEGTVFPENGPPLRRIRLRYIEATEWREEAGSARYRMWRPAEQELWVPVVAY